MVWRNESHYYSGYHCDDLFGSSQESTFNLPKVPKSTYPFAVCGTDLLLVSVDTSLYTQATSGNNPYASLFPFSEGVIGLG